LIKAFEDAEICVSPQLLSEYRDIPQELFRKRKIDKEQFKGLIAGIAAFASGARVVFPRTIFEVCRDPKDNTLLECCAEARADILITGDKDLLDIDKLPFRLRILTPRAFITTA